jgi:bacterioferritin-associated ferredoxin
MDDDEIVCNCMSVTLGDIKDAIENGASTFEEVQEVTNIATGCGQCEDEARRIVDELLEK